MLQCSGCGHVFNRDFDPATQRWDEKYEETQAFSAHFSGFSAKLADKLIDRWNLKGKRILELGCGKGDFLAELCRGGRNLGLGIDPAFDAERRPTGSESIRYVKEMFQPGHLEFQPDLIVCRHTLEHLADPGILLSPLAPHPGIPVFIDVPHLDWIVQESAFWDIYYEHCNYFNAYSLQALLGRLGIDIDATETGFDGQYLMVYGRTGTGHKPISGTPPQADFGPNLASMALAWERQLGEWREQGTTTLLWGGGSRAVAFLSGLGPEAAEQVAGVVDINPHKQGRFLPGVATRVLAPGQLTHLEPDHIVVLNPAYRVEIGEHLQQLNVDCELVDVTSTSVRARVP